jgi:hypothetical protein
MINCNKKDGIQFPSFLFFIFGLLVSKILWIDMSGEPLKKVILIAVFDES